MPEFKFENQAQYQKFVANFFAKFGRLNKVFNVAVETEGSKYYMSDFYEILEAKFDHKAGYFAINNFYNKMIELKEADAKISEPEKKVIKMSDEEFKEEILDVLQGLMTYHKRIWLADMDELDQAVKDGVDIREEDIDYDNKKAIIAEAQKNREINRVGKPEYYRQLKETEEKNKREEEERKIANEKAYQAQLRRKQLEEQEREKREENDRKVAEIISTAGYGHVDYSDVDSNAVITGLYEAGKDKTVSPDLIKKISTNKHTQLQSALKEFNNDKNTSFNKYYKLLDEAKSRFNNSDLYTQLMDKVKETANLINDVQNDNPENWKEAISNNLETLTFCVEQYLDHAKNDALSSHSNMDTRIRKVVVVEALDEFINTTSLKIRQASSSSYTNGLKGEVLNPEQAKNISEAINKIDSVFELRNLNTNMNKTVQQEYKSNKQILEVLAAFAVKRMANDIIEFEHNPNEFYDVIKNEGFDSAKLKLMNSNAFANFIKDGTIGEIKGNLLTANEKISKLAKDVAEEISAKKAAEENEKELKDLDKKKELDESSDSIDDPINTSVTLLEMNK